MLSSPRMVKSLPPMARTEENMGFLFLRHNKLINHHWKILRQVAGYMLTRRSFSEETKGDLKILKLSNAASSKPLSQWSKYVFTLLLSSCFLYAVHTMQSPALQIA